ncbi:Zinc finger, FYVE/PHD-type [Metarhizium rileyi]|uniref:Zinc finger, FYVE/PHD-type n=1 Tax=Metarhizium rileyi (strain RCEF 4871) TaxID=1649241 RepID=A0A162JL24_METRR|nr:Zinc finger, FYVE/PHD-type [Metarhizium rileyi RCEF 4871]
MTDTPAPPSTQASLPSQTVPPAPVDTVAKDDPAIPATAQQTEEEPYTIKCICNFSDDDGNTIYCETCDTWQHIDCFYPNNREEAIREDFAHSCAECNPRPLDRQKAIERTLRLRNANSILETQKEPLDKRAKRLPTKGARKKPKPNDLQINGHAENGKQGSPPPLSSSKKPKLSHRPSHSVGSQPAKRSPSYGHNSRSNPAHPLSPATTPPDLPNDFLIHHYSAGFCALYNEEEVTDTHNNAFVGLAIPAALSRWLRDPETMKQEVGRTRAEVFQDEPPIVDEARPKLEVNDTTRFVEPGTTLRWRCIESTAAVEKDVPLIELNGLIGFQKDYCADAANVWTDLSCPLPFVFFHPSLPLYIDTRKEGSRARYVRRSCKPNAQLDTYLSGESDYHFWLVSDRYISANEQITLPWDFRLEKSVRDRWLHLLGLSDDDSVVQEEPELDSAEYNAISNWIDRILSEYGGCACDLENNCAFARFHRQYLFGRQQGKGGKKKSRKARNYTISPTSTGHATNSRAASEGNIDEAADDINMEEGSRSKPPSRDRTPVASFDQLGILTEPTDRDKRKVAMVEDSFRRMEQQQPARKKKRVSDGTTSSSKPKSRTGSAGPPGQYVDTGTSRSKSGSPASVRSPSIGFPKLQSKPCLSAAGFRQTSAGPRAMYCDAIVQTDTVEGSWTSESSISLPIRKRVIPLSQRLMNNRRRCLSTDEERKQSCLASQPSNVSAMELDSPTSEHRPSVASTGSDATSPTSQTTDATMTEANQGLVLNGTTMEAAKTKTPDLRVQLPPVPAFDNTGLVMSNTATPLSAASSTALSPFGTPSVSNTFAIGSINGIVATPSPVKKKLSLSDYKSRLNKAAGKAAGGTGLLKPGPASPDNVKVELTMEPQPLDKTDDSTPAVNGA